MDVLLRTAGDTDLDDASDTGVINTARGDIRTNQNGSAGRVVSENVRGVGSRFLGSL
jgi:hypothetical protein